MRARKSLPKSFLRGGLRPFAPGPLLTLPGWIEVASLPPATGGVAHQGVEAGSRGLQACYRAKGVGFALIVFERAVLRVTRAALVRPPSAKVVHVQ
ncbi:MAG: hypothetical protein ACOH1V_02770 [Stenotrophomonas sp.]